MLYMMLQHSFDVLTNEELFLVKVGESRSINQRKQDYKTHNPSALMAYSTAGTEGAERSCHNYLKEKGQHFSGEWYLVSKDFFHHCLENGFDGFPLPRKNQNIYKKY